MDQDASLAAGIAGYVASLAVLNVLLTKGLTTPAEVRELIDQIVLRLETADALLPDDHRPRFAWARQLLSRIVTGTSEEP